MKFDVAPESIITDAAVSKVGEQRATKTLVVKCFVFFGVSGVDVT